MNTIVVAGPRDLVVPLEDIYYEVQVVGVSHFDETVRVLQGGCPSGVDLCARQMCRKYGIECLTQPAMWGMYGKKAGPLRNMKMAQDGDALTVFVKGAEPVSSGTASIIAEFKRVGKTVDLVEVYG